MNAYISAKQILYQRSSLENRHTTTTHKLMTNNETSLNRVRQLYLFCFSLKKKCLPHLPPLRGGLLMHAWGCACTI